MRGLSAVHLQAELPPSSCLPVSRAVAHRRPHPPQAHPAAHRHRTLRRLGALQSLLPPDEAQLHRWRAVPSLPLEEADPPRAARLVAPARALVFRGARFPLLGRQPRPAIGPAVGPAVAAARQPSCPAAVAGVRGEAIEPQPEGQRVAHLCVRALAAAGTERKQNMGRKLSAASQRRWAQRGLGGARATRGRTRCGAPLS